MIPVIHSKDKYAARTYGMWMYYARGCSDIEYNVGYTFPAKNRLHAAIKLTMNDTCDSACAAEQVRHGLTTLKLTPSLLSEAIADILQCPPTESAKAYSIVSGSGVLDAYVRQRLRARGYDSLQPTFSHRAPCEIVTGKRRCGMYETENVRISSCRVACAVICAAQIGGKPPYNAREAAMFAQHDASTAFPSKR